jgi:hypothetical protein
VGIQKNTASISESNQFRTKFYPRLFIFTTVGVIRRRRSRRFLSLFNPRRTKLTTFQQRTSRDFLICFCRFSSDWRQCAIPAVVIKNLFLSASSLFAQAMLEVLISAPIICVSVPLSLCVYFSMHPQTKTNTESMLLLFSFWKCHLHLSKLSKTDTQKSNLFTTDNYNNS